MSFPNHIDKKQYPCRIPSLLKRIVLSLVYLPFRLGSTEKTGQDVHVCSQFVAIEEDWESVPNEDKSTRMQKCSSLDRV
jgi:hypothetical protein